MSIAKSGPFVELHEAVAELMTVDPSLELIRDFEFTPRTLRGYRELAPSRRSRLESKSSTRRVRAIDSRGRGWNRHRRNVRSSSLSISIAPFEPLGKGTGDAARCKSAPHCNRQRWPQKPPSTAAAFDLPRQKGRLGPMGWSIAPVFSPVPTVACDSHGHHRDFPFPVFKSPPLAAPTGARDRQTQGRGEGRLSLCRDRRRCSPAAASSARMGQRCRQSSA